MNILDVMKEIGKRWQKITASDKDYFQKKADLDKLRFKKEQENFQRHRESLEQQEKNRLQEEMKSEQDSPGGKQRRKNQGKNGFYKEYENPEDIVMGSPIKKSKKDPNMPKKPLSAYIYFSQEVSIVGVNVKIREVIKRENPHMPVAEIMKEVSVRWSKMLKENKKPYEELAQRDKKRYERELYEVK